MIQALSGRIASWLICQKVIQREDRELYKYAIYNLMLTFFPLPIMFLIGSMMGKVKESILIILPFIMLRKFGGGYHLKDERTCLICSVFLLSLCVYLSSRIDFGAGISLTSLVSAISLTIFSPIDSENRRLTKDEKKRYKKITGGLSVVFLLLSICLKEMHFEQYAVCAAIGMDLSAAVQIPCISCAVLNKYMAAGKQ